jgi:hypothetical protein
MRRFFVLGVTLAAIACAPLATREEFDRQIANVIGKNINDIMVKLGPPLQTYQMPNGNKMYTFVLAQQTSRQPTVTTAKVDPGIGGYGPIKGSAVTTGGDIVSSSCQVEFTADNTRPDCHGSVAVQ